MKSVKIRSLFIFSIALLFEVPASAKDSLVLSVQSQVLPSTTIALGEPAQIAVTVTANQNISVSTFSLPAMDDFAVNKTEILPAEKKSETKWESKATIAFIPLNLGEVQFPSFAIPYRTEGGDPSILQTPPVKLTVAPAFGEQASPELLKDIKPPVKAGGIPLFWLILSGLILAFFLSWFAMNRKKLSKNIEAPLPPAQPPDEAALEKLEWILGQYKQNGDFKLFYSELSNILREYLAGRYEIDALEKTTSEIFFEMREKGLDRKTCQLTKEVLASCDLVKFAKLVPSAQQPQEDCEKTKLFIENTRSPGTTPSSGWPPQ